MRHIPPTAKPMLASATLALGVLLLSSACGSTVCPKGSSEVDGKCTEITAEGMVSEETDAGSDAGSDATATLEECEAGFTRVGEKCESLCTVSADGEAPCHADATCALEDGVAVCSCKQGYEGDGKVCSRKPCEPLAGQDAVCGEHATCSVVEETSAECACDAGFANCDETPGCEVSIADDAANCGGCGLACAAGIACIEGACQPRYKQIALAQRPGQQCVVSQEGEAHCWGDLMPIASAASDTPVRVTVADGLTQLAVADRHACGVNPETSTLACWGHNYLNVLGAPTYEVSQTTHVQVVPSIEKVAVGYDHSCALVAGKVYCWGFGRALADGATYTVSGNTAQRGLDLTKPVQVVTGVQLSGATDISSAWFGGCALLRTGAVQCWGWVLSTNATYRAESILLESKQAPQALLLLDAQAICQGYEYGCALRSSGEVACWGADPKWYAENPESAQAPARTLARPIDGVRDVVELACGYRHMCTLNTQGEVHCWGDNTIGQVGLGTSQAWQSAPFHVSSLPQVTRIFAGIGTCAQTRDGRTFCWGHGPSAPQTSPAELEGWP